MMAWLRRLILIGIVVAVVLSAWMLYYARTPLNIMPSAQDIVIKSNSGLRSIAQQLVDQKVIATKWSFILLAKLLNKEASLQAGEYTLNRNVTPYQLIMLLNHGKTTQGSITFIEGKTFQHMRERLAQHPAIKTTIAGRSNQEVMVLLGAQESHPEGLFFPDTFYFDRETQDLVILKRSYAMMQAKLQQAWDSRMPGLPYKNSYEALIMASIIEKETGKASERKVIAGVFLNRMRMGMRLQTDPTVIYGLGIGFDGNIRRKDLHTDTPYNTYTRGGLPPTPIAMPGLASIEAALNPEPTKALYFVGIGDGSHVFSNTLAEHNRAVVKYQLKK